MRTLQNIKNKLHGLIGDYRPTAMQLEVTNACNFRCIMCPFHGPEKASERSIGFMNISEYIQILEEFKNLGGSFLIPQGAGESFLHPKISEMLRIAKTKFGLSVGFNTNGALLTKDYMELLLELQIDELGFSVDALQADTFRSITGGNLLDVSQKVEMLVDMRRNAKVRYPKIRVLIVEQVENRQEIDEYIERWLPIVDEVIIQSRRIESGRKMESPRIEERRPCRHLFDTVFVQWDGEMVICCEDWESVTSIGNVFETPLTELWKSSEMQKYREAQSKHLWNPPAICRDCEAWAGGREIVRDHGDRVETISALTRVWQRKT
ncbi:radical SAM protein [bacterium]|nr:radical SAM protein [bacterium]